MNRYLVFIVTCATEEVSYHYSISHYSCAHTDTPYLFQGLTNEKLRDEILCQLCNQTWKNDNEANAERGWLLMSNCLSVFPPSDTLYKYLLK